MLTTLVTLACLALVPADRTANLAETEGLVDCKRPAARCEETGATEERQGASVIVRGTVELSEAEADAAAAALAVDKVRRMLAQRGDVVLADRAPLWFPDFARQQVVQRWLRAVDAHAAVRVVHRERTTHDHGALGTSFRTALTIEADDQQIQQHLGRLRRQVGGAAESFAVKCGGIAGLWAVLGLAVSWLDRLSRGYMTWRLRLLGLGTGIAIPAVLLFLV